MDLTQIEKMILEILSEKENINEAPIIDDIEAEFKPTDRAAMKKFLQKNLGWFYGLRNIAKQAQKLQALDEELSDFNMFEIQKIWQNHIKNDKDLPDGLEQADVNQVVHAIAGNELAKKFGPLAGYNQMLANLSKTIGKIGLFEEEVSPAMKELLEKWERMFKGVKDTLGDIIRKPLKAGGKINIYPIKNLVSMLETLKEAILDVKEFYDSLPDETETPDETDTDDDGIPDEEEREDGTDPTDPTDPTTTTDSPEEAGPADPETLDVAPTAEEKLKAAFENFRDKFYCDIPEGANRREETEALEDCRSRGVAVTQNEQHAYIRALIDALEPIVNAEEREAFRGRPETVAEAKGVNVKSYKQSVFNFYRRAQSIISFMEKAQKNAGNRTGKLHLKRAIAKIEDLIKNSGIIYDDLRDLMNQVLKLRSGSEETVTEELLDEKKSSAEKIEKVYNLARRIVQAAIEKIDAATPGAIRDDLPELKKVLKKLKKIEKLFPKGKLGGKRSTSPDKIADDYKEALEILKEPVNDFYKLKNKIRDRGTVDQIASSIREFVKTLTKMFKLKMPAEFNDPVEDVASPTAPPTADPADPATPDASLEKARRKYGRVRFIRDLPDEDRESFLKFMALMMEAGILSEGFIDKLLGRHINFKKLFGSNAVSGRIENAIKKLDRPDRKRVVAILKQKEKVEAFANLIRSKVDKKSVGNVGQIKAMFSRGRASYDKISRKYPEITGEMYDSIIIFHILTTGDKKLTENNPKSIAKTFGRKTVKFQNKFGQVYSNDRIVDTLKLLKSKLNPTFRILIDFFENKPKELNYVLKSIALGTRGKRIEFDPKDFRKLATVKFHTATGGDESGEESDTEEESGELEGGKSAVKQIGAWLKNTSDRTNPENLKKIATWMTDNKDQLKYVKGDAQFKINTVEYDEGFDTGDGKLKINYGLAGKKVAFNLDKSDVAKEFAKRMHWNRKPFVGFFGRFRMEEEIAEMLVPIIQQEMRVMNG